MDAATPYIMKRLKSQDSRAFVAMYLCSYLATYLSIEVGTYLILRTEAIVPEATHLMGQFGAMIWDGRGHSAMRLFRC